MGQDQHIAASAFPEAVEERLMALEHAVDQVAAALDGLAQQVVTRHLSVVDGQGRERVRATVAGTTAEVVLQLPPGDVPAELVAYATAAGADGVMPEAPAMGLQLRAHGDAVAEMDASPGGTGRWQARMRWPTGAGRHGAPGSAVHCPAPPVSARSATPPPPP